MIHGVACLDLMINGDAHRILDLWLAAVYVLDVVAFLAHCRVHVLRQFNFGPCPGFIQGPV